MTKQLVSFVNPNFAQGPQELNAYYLPYSAAILWAYARQFPEIDDNFELGKFIWRRDPIPEVVESLKDNALVGFSTYIWNRNYNFTLARELKKANPDIVIVFGGPEPAIEKPDFFVKYPFVDVCVKKEGEIAFKRLLECGNSKVAMTKIPGLLVNMRGTKIDTGDSPRINELDTIPSPYLTGIFDHLYEQFPEVTWNATLETNRGCPYHCTFCDWGSLTYSKVKKFDINRVFAELEWIGQKCDFVSITDANFGIFAERDSAIADKLIEVQQKYGILRNYTISWAKNQKQEIVDIVHKLIYNGGAKIGLNLSVQTLDDGVLDNIKRKNLETNKIEEVFDLCEKNNIPLYTELILGLPGETLETWKENFYKLFRANNHTGVTVYQAQMLENAEMNLVQREEYEITSQPVYDYLVGTYNEHEVRESIEVVTGTRDMPRDDMLEAQVYSWFINTFHINGITNYISRFLERHQGLDYGDFYERLYTRIKEHDWLNEQQEHIRRHYDLWATKGQIDHGPIGNIEIHGWNLIHSTIIRIHKEQKYKEVFLLVDDFLREFNLDPLMHAELMKLQQSYFIDYANIDSYPLRVDFDYNFLGYMQGNSELNVATTLEFEFPEDKTMSLQRFCENIFYARRRNFGKAWVTQV